MLTQRHAGYIVCVAFGLAPAPVDIFLKLDVDLPTENLPLLRQQAPRWDHRDIIRSTTGWHHDLFNGGGERTATIDALIRMAKLDGVDPVPTPSPSCAIC